MARSNIIRFLDSLSSKNSIRYAVYSFSIIFFFALILLPPILGIILKWNTMSQIFEDHDLLSSAMNAIYASFAIAIFVSIIDIVAGLPMAWFIARGKSRWLSVLDTLTDIPFIVPTVTLGYSLLLFWSEPQGISSLFGVDSLISPGWLLIILLHFAFSYPAIVRVMVGALLDYKQEYEQAARTLGATPFTAGRTVTFPILKHSLVAAFTLAFARSISETGATMMVAGAFQHGPIFIKTHPDQEGPLVFVSFVLIAVACLIYAAIRLAGPRLKIPIQRVWPATEKKLSSSGAVTLRNGATLLVFFLMVLIPALFVALPTGYAIFSDILNKALRGVGVWEGYWQSLLLSYFLGVVVTLLNVILSLPMAILIARKRLGTVPSTILDVLVNIPMIIPSIALGFSLGIFWTENFSFIPEIWLLIFAHLSITYPYFVRSMSAAVERIPIELEEAARTLGARPFSVFKTIILPLTKYSLFAGAIMVFTRSVDETGATLAVKDKLSTAPVLLFNWVTNTDMPVPATQLDISLGCAILVAFSFIILLILRFIARGKR